MADIDKLRLELDSLDKQRREVETRIRDSRQAQRGRPGNARGGENHGRSRNDSGDYGNKRRRGAEDEEESDRQRPKPKIMSAVVALHQDEPSKERPEAVAAYQNPETVNRNRRMFGALMGHLGSASRRLKQDEALLQKQEQVQKEVQHKVEEETTRLRELQRRIHQEEKEKEYRARDELLAKQRRTEVLLAQAAFMKQHEPMKHFIPTKTPPSLFFLPARHNDTTAQLLASYAAEIEDKIKAREEADRQKLEEIDRIVPEGVERRRVRKEERDARFRTGEQRQDAGDDEADEAEAKGRHDADDDESEEDIDALERELDTEDTGIEVIDGKHAKPVERWEQKDQHASEPDEEKEETKQEPERQTRRRSARQSR